MAASRPANSHEAQNGDAFGDAEPPPAYTSIATAGSTTVEGNFARPYEIQDSGYTPHASTATGVPSSAAAASSSSSSSSTHAPHTAPLHQHHPHPAGAPPNVPPRHPSVSSHNTGNSFQHPSGPPPNHGGPAPHPHIDGISSFNRPALPNQPPAHTAALSPSSQPTQYAPTVNPTSGQPLLRRGAILVYTHGFYCQKCREFCICCGYFCPELMGSRR